MALSVAPHLEPRGPVLSNATCVCPSPSVLSLGTQMYTNVHSQSHNDDRFWIQVIDAESQHTADDVQMLHGRPKYRVTYLEKEKDRLSFGYGWGIPRQEWSFQGDGTIEMACTDGMPDPIVLSKDDDRDGGGLRLVQSSENFDNNVDGPWDANVCCIKCGTAKPPSPDAEWDNRLTCQGWNGKEWQDETWWRNNQTIIHMSSDPGPGGVKLAMRVIPVAGIRSAAPHYRAHQVFLVGAVLVSLFMATI